MVLLDMMKLVELMVLIFTIMAAVVVVVEYSLELVEQVA
jgi:hypothetical protein